MKGGDLFVDNRHLNVFQNAPSPLNVAGRLDGIRKSSGNGRGPSAFKNNWKKCKRICPSRFPYPDPRKAPGAPAVPPPLRLTFILAETLTDQRHPRDFPKPPARPAPPPRPAAAPPAAATPSPHYSPRRLSGPRHIPRSDAGRPAPYTRLPRRAHTLQRVYHHLALLVAAPPKTAVLIMACMSAIFFSMSSICACTRRIPTEFSVTVSATSVEMPLTLSRRIWA